MSYLRDSSEDLIYNSQTGQYEPVPSTATLTINPTPNDATVTLTAAGYTQSGNSITVDIGTSVSYTVEKIGYATRSSTITVTEDQTLSIELILLSYTLTIDPTPADAMVTLSATGYTQVGNSITVPYGTSVVYYVTKDGYTPVSNQTTVTADNTIAVTMIPLNYTLTINPTPSDASVTFNTGTVSGNTCTVPYNTSVTYTVSKNKYVSQSATVTILADQTINVTLNKQQVTLTLNSVPADAKKEIYVGSSQTPIIIASTYVTDIDTTLTYKVSKSGYVTVRDTIVMDTNKTINVILEEGYLVKDLDASSVFIENAIINSVDLHNKPWVNNSMYNAFQDCYRLTQVTNINNSVTNMSRAYAGCSNLVNVPEIPDTVVGSLASTFEGCTSLVNIPTIPNGITNLNRTFAQCRNLSNAPTIPNSVTDMISTFQQCQNMIIAPNIPSSAINIGYTFQNCYNLIGNVYIESENVINAINCFVNTSLIKNVYIPFNYSNKQHTATYNAFIAAGYDTLGTQHGVYLKNINPTYVDVEGYEYNMTAPKEVTLTKYIGGSTTVTIPEPEER